MNTQNQIKPTLSESTRIEYVCSLLESNEIPHRSELASRVCKQFEFYDVRGQEQRGGCLKALRELEVAGHFTLPAARTQPGRSSQDPRWVWSTEVLWQNPRVRAVA
jgi:hypothetical protein